MSYTQLSRKKRPHRIVEELVSSKNFVNKNVLDLGAGPLTESIFLSASNFKVDAVDKDQASFKKSLEPEIENVVFHHKDINDFNFKKEHYGLVVSLLTLPFLEEKDFYKIINKIRNATVSGGYILLSVFGENDEWNGVYDKMTFLSKEQVRALFPGDKYLRLVEEEKIGKTVKGQTKDWHIFTILIEKAR